MMDARESVGQPAGGRASGQVVFSANRLVCRRLVQVGTDIGVGFAMKSIGADSVRLRIGMAGCPERWADSNAIL